MERPADTPKKRPATQLPLLPDELGRPADDEPADDEVEARRAGRRQRPTPRRAPRARRPAVGGRPRRPARWALDAETRRIGLEGVATARATLRAAREARQGDSHRPDQPHAA